LKSLPIICSLALLIGCVASRPDHFYVLSSEPAEPHGARSVPAIQATLRVTLPSVVDRPELTLASSRDGVIILEHERWAAPLADLVSQTLARDIERRRGDLLIAVPGANRPPDPAVKIAVDLVQVRLRRGERASIETQWRVFDARKGKEVVGSDVFVSAAKSDEYADVARGLSECVSLLAERLAAQMPQSE